MLGVNLGKNAATPLPDAPADYLAVLEALADLAAYAVVNVSSPNTQGLRDLQERRALEALLGAVVQRRDSLARRHGRRLPLLVKVSPDLDWAGLGAVLEAVGATGVEGIVATNTTLAREGLSDPRRAEAGGLSGAPCASGRRRWCAGWRGRRGAPPAGGCGGDRPPRAGPGEAGRGRLVGAALHRAHLRRPLASGSHLPRPPGLPGAALTGSPRRSLQFAPAPRPRSGGAAPRRARRPPGGRARRPAVGWAAGAACPCPPRGKRSANRPRRRGGTRSAPRPARRTPPCSSSSREKRASLKASNTFPLTEPPLIGRAPGG